MAITLTNIPAIMRHHHWDNGAALLDRWFAGASASAPSYGPADTSTVRMDSWVLKFTRAKQVYDQLIRDRVWANTAVQPEIKRMLTRKGLLIPGGTGLFGNFSLPVPTQDPDYVNARVMTEMPWDLDDMAAALGRFAFRVLVAGRVRGSGTPTKYDVTIEEVGIYVRDSFDFNGSQHLGFWNDATNEVSAMNPMTGDRVDNDHFRAWRTANGRGGDFIVFSDLKRVRLTTPDTFVLA